MSINDDLIAALQWLYEVAKVEDDKYAAVTNAATILERAREQVQPTYRETEQPVGIPATFLEGHDEADPSWILCDRLTFAAKNILAHNFERIDAAKEAYDALQQLRNRQSTKREFSRPVKCAECNAEFDVGPKDLICHDCSLRMLPERESVNHEEIAATLANAQRWRAGLHALSIAELKHPSLSWNNAMDDATALVKEYEIRRRSCASSEQ